MTLSSPQISELLPHRYPFLLVDRVLELIPGEYCRAVKNVSVNEEYFVGHFPGQPTMPGVLILEAMAQAGALIIVSTEEHAGKIPYLAGADKVRYKRMVVPGDVLTMEIKLLWHRRGFGRITCRATVEGDMVAEAEISYALTIRGR